MTKVLKTNTDSIIRHWRENIHTEGRKPPLSAVLINAFALVSDTANLRS